MRFAQFSTPRSTRLRDTRQMDAEALVTAAVGGSIGSVLTLLAGVPEQLRSHDRSVSEYDDDLAQWVADEAVRLERETERAKNEAGQQLYSGSHLRALAHLKEECLHRYRDQERGARGKRAALLDSEGFRHRAWRWASRRGPLPDLSTPSKAELILDAWRSPVTEGGHASPVSDPTKRSLTWAVAKYGNAGGSSSA